MSEKNIVRRSFEQLGPSRTDWEALDALTDQQIDTAIASDSDAAAPLDEEWFRDAEFVAPVKIATSLRVDADVITWFRGQGRGWQTRMNQVLRAYAKVHGGVK